MMESKTCCSCSAPATIGARCTYCAHRINREPGYRDNVDANPRNKAATERMAAMDRAERPRSTATSREIAKGHPVCWPSQEGEE